jgi:hypothetical protein
MPITTFIDPAKLPNRAQPKPDFDRSMGEYFRLLPQFGSDLNVLAASIGALAAGGAYAFPYIFDSATTDVDPGPGKLRLSSATQNAATVMRIDVLNQAGVSLAGMFDALQAASSSIKGAARIVKQSDPSKWLLFDFSAISAGSGYRNMSLAFRAGSDASPFANGDPLMVFLQPAGEKGSTGDLLAPMIHVNHTQAGSNGGTNLSGVNIRTLNTVVRNTLSGASLASNRVTIPAGTYRVRGNAPAFGVGGHQAYLYSITASANLLIGGSEYQSGNVSRSMLQGELVIAVPTVFELRHWTGSASGSLGQAVGAGAGLIDVYSELIFEKIA